MVTTGDRAVHAAPARQAVSPRRPPPSCCAPIGMLLVCATLGLMAGLAWGHAALVRSTPAQRAMLARPPDRVRLWFSEPLEAKFAAVSVWDASGKQIDQQDGLVGPEDPKAMSVGIPTLGPGTYTVKYRVLSVDGHVVEGSYRFTVRPAP